MAREAIAIHSEYITLDAFLKWAGVADTGGIAKTLITSGQIRVNGEVELRRGRKLRAGDAVEMDGVGSWLLTREGD